MVSSEFKVDQVRDILPGQVQTRSDLHAMINVVDLYVELCSHVARKQPDVILMDIRGVYTTAATNVLSVCCYIFFSSAKTSDLI